MELATATRQLVGKLAARLRREDGVATLELAIVLPVLLLILLGIFDFGEFLNYSTDETHLAAEAARYAAVNSDPGGSTSLQTYILNQASPGLLTTSGDVTTPAQVYLYYPTGSTGAAGQPVRACVTAKVQFLPFLGLGSATITQTATMRLEQAATNWTPNSISSLPASCPTS